jgi:acyl carrier protein
VEASGAVLVRGNVSIFQVTPSRLQLMVSLPEAAEGLKSLKFLLVGGEVFPESLLEKAKPLVSGRIFNMYGPTETTIWSTVKEVSGQAALNIGKPISNTQVYIVDKTGKPQPIGVVGELLIGGDGLARGYLNRPQLTAEKFLNRSYILYKTGDLARWLPDGNIEFLGRVDYQVKIRGFRIELGEIENRLLMRHDITEAVVLCRADASGDKYLCAYYIAGQELPVPELREYLSNHLPEYMIPSHFVHLERIPLTPNGKLDKKALSEPGFTAGKTYTPPGNEIEEKLVGIWSEVLCRDTAYIGIDHNFFELGGHSLKATIALSRVHKEMHAHIPLTEFFKIPTIRKLAAYIQNSVRENFEPIEPAEEREYYELSPSQKRMFTLHKLYPSNPFYNITVSTTLNADPDKEEYERIFRRLIGRHESLRTSFEMRDETFLHRVHSEVDFEIEYYDSASEDAENPFVRAFDLSKAPLMRARLVKLEAGKYLLKVDMHHIISDGTSHYILGEEFRALSEGKELAPVRAQYKDYVRWHYGIDRQIKLKRQEGYWLGEFSRIPPALNLPADYKRPDEPN